MRLHEREPIVLKASADLRMAVVDWEREHDLSNLEAHAVILDVLGTELGQYFKYEIRMERHGNYDEPGGVA